MTGNYPPANQEDSAGSPVSGEPVFLVAGKLRRPHGLHGDMLMEVQTDFPERLEAGVEVYVGDRHERLRIKRCRWHGNLMRIGFSGLDDRDAVGIYRNSYVYVQSNDSPVLPDGEYYHHQLIGLRVKDESGEKLGVVENIIETGANDVLQVRENDDREILLPVIDPVILDINLDAGELTVHILPGLLPE